MITKQTVEKYFNLMKSRGFIDALWYFDAFWNDNQHIKIHYLHKSGKRSSYRVLKEDIIKELRDNKLKNLLD